MKHADHLYLQVAEGLEKMIGEDVLKIGDRLPSVRMLSNEYGISMGTAFQAYYHLEGKGLIESRPKSGYYVRFNHKRLPAVPQPSLYPSHSHEVSVNEMISAIYGDIASHASQVVNFALAVPHPSLLPVARLNKSVVQALRNEEDSCIGYEHTQGHPELRKQLARLAFNWGGKIKPDEIITTNGCLEAITLCMRAITKAGDTVAVESPNYFGIFQAMENLGLKVVEIPSCAETGLDLDSLQSALKKYRIKACVVVPNFNNPLGSAMPDERKKQLVEIITAKQVPLVEDDIYGELYFGRQRPRTCKTYDTRGLVLHCSSLSKSLAPGYRVGWVIPGKFMEEVRELKRMQNISSPTLTQAAMAHYLQHGRHEYHLRKMRKALHTQCLRYTQSLIEHFPGGTRISRPRGGLALWVELPKKTDTFRLRTEAMKQGISIVPGKIFSAGERYGHCLRISFGSPWSEDAEWGIRVLGKLVKS